ncbi:hypothetical protein Mal64_34720 [Pseudobythopirellula maris]|uniref:Uncharacterized protein n=1 Tax=Pseudobythopirellula maris TaxID=2527991 RepID=A0A5C5ZJM3_9BACT|nr:hypothetical protein [Pseudobythopirellula maris]TWT86643.1 hypothetical protein Mal64_34720 [Pseudobythopirellula maris]
MELVTPGSTWAADVGRGLRWVLFIPAGAVGGFFASCVANFSMGFSGYSQDSPFVSFMVMVALGTFSVWAAVMVAPCENKTAPAVAMGTLTLLFFGFSAIALCSVHAWGDVLYCLVGGGAAAFAMKNAMVIDGSD